MRRNAGVWAGVFLLVVAGVLMQQSLRLDYANMLGPWPGFLPRWLSGILMIVSLCYLWDSVRNEVIPLSELWPVGKAQVDIGLMLLGLVVFALIVESLGFVVAASQLIFLMTVRRFRWPLALLASIGISVALLLAFQKLLGVALPVNDWGW